MTADDRPAGTLLRMMTNKTLWATLSVIVGGMQALDSGILQAGPFAQVLTILGIAAPAAALAWSTNRGLWLAALIAGALLFVWARIVSPVSLNAMHIGLMVPAMYVLFVWRLEKQVAA
jgi:hypothetical protein